MRAVAVRDPANYAAGADDGTVRMQAGGTEESVTVDSEVAVRSVAYTADGDLLVGDDVGALACYDPARLERPAGRTVLGRAISGVAAGTDGTVVSGTTDGLVAVFTGAAGPDCRPDEWTRIDLAAASDAVTSVALAAGDELAIFGTADGEVELWDLARRRQVGALTVGSGDAAAFGASQAGASTLVAASGGAVDVYRLDRDDLRAELCELAGRDLTADEMAAFLPDPGTRDAGRCG
jgi:WD40 repeat protein